MEYEKYIDSATALQQKEGGYGGSLEIQFSALVDEIKEITMPMPDVQSLRKSYIVRSDKSLTQEDIRDELRLNQQINFHFASLKANYRGLDSCHWMKGEQIQSCWARLGEKLPVVLSDDFDDAYYFDINVIESQLYPEGVGVIVATVPNDGSRKPIQRPRTLRHVRADVCLSEVLALSRAGVITVKDMIDKEVLEPLASGAIYDVRIVVDPDSKLHEEAPYYGFIQEDDNGKIIRDGRTIECIASTKEASIIMELLDINYRRPARPKHVEPYQQTTVDVGYFALPLRYSGWKRYISELNACYHELSDIDDGFGDAPNSDLPEEVGQEGKSKRLIEDDEMIANLRSTDSKRPLSRNDIIRRRKKREKELVKAQGETVELVPELTETMEDVFYDTNIVVNIDDIPNL